MKNAIAVTLLAALAATFTQPILAQDSRDAEPGLRLMNARMAQMSLTRAARLGTSADADTFFVGHTTTAPFSQPWHVGRGPYRPGVGDRYDGMWDFDTYDGGTIDSMQGWVQTVSPNTRTSGTKTDDQRPWNCLDWGNRIDAAPVQGRTPGIVSAWHVDGGANWVSSGAATASPSWSPLAGNASAWCGLRAGDDDAVIESGTLGGTGNAVNGSTVFGQWGNGMNPTQHLFPGYANQWDQMLYRDVRVATGSSLTVSFLYQTRMDPRTNTAAGTCKGWFDKDPLSNQQGGTGVGASNFISASGYLGAMPRSGPVDSFMVYVGVPTDPAACRYTDYGAPRPIFDLKRRWFSEVIAIDKPYQEILSTFGADSAYRSSPFTITLDNATLQPMIDVQGATAGVPGPHLRSTPDAQDEPEGGGIIRIVFRSKTNADYSDETGTGGAFNSGTEGAVRIDDVAITGCTPAFTTSGFETAGEIDDTIEGANSATPGPAVGQGYAFAAWHSTAKPPKLMAHTHPLFGGDVGPGNYYPQLDYQDLCGPPDSPIRQCNINNVIISTTDHDLGEAAGGGTGLSPFKENRNGALSPTINLVTPATGVNDIGLDRVHVETNADWQIFYDMYSGIFSPAAQGNVWGNAIQCWPATQANGARTWSELYVSGVWSNGDKQCFLMTDVLNNCIFTSNSNGLPDSCKLWIFREQRCTSWNVTTGCSPTEGHYFDNVALVLPPPFAGVPDKITMDLWDWYTDAFPANETTGLPGTLAFDTCGALIQNARNNAATTGGLLRFDVPGDSMYIRSHNATGEPMRMDCVFRILPGPGNYVMVGNKRSALRKVPSNPAPAVSGDLSFWGQYLADNGAFGTPGGHGAAWSQQIWNSVRLDTVELNLFPVDGKTPNLPGLAIDFWMSTLHEDDPKFGALGIVKNRCFLADTSALQPNNSLNITCSSVPAWLTTDPEIALRAGFDGVQTSREGTKIFPDGLLTAGSHIQYFFRMSHLSTPSAFVMLPDTNRITPQMTGPAWNYDAMRWEGISILPDRWKDASYGGLGSACLLVVDYNDRRGDEKVWVSTCDSIGATVSSKYGAHNGWHCTAAYVAPDGSHDFTGQTDLGSNPTIAVWSHGGQPGTTWDLYNVKAAESSTTGANQIGSRLANRTGMGLMTGKQSMQGPTPEMLRAYYKLVFLMSGDLNNVFFGAVNDRSQDDIALLQSFLTYQANENTPRGIWAMGHGFVEGNTGVDAAHTAFLTNNLAVSLRDPSYFALSGSVVRYPDLIPSTVITTGGQIYCAENSCLFTNDVLTMNSAIPGATPASWYQSLGAVGPYVSGVYAPSTSGHPYVSLVSGWDMWNLFSRRGGDTRGRLEYFANVMTNVFGSVCPFYSPCPLGCGDVPQGDAPAVDFLGNVWGNPMAAGGMATVSFSLARPDRVEAKVYDVAGRLVRTLADREFQAGPRKLTWDGTDDHGRQLARGVYFTAVRYVRGGFHGERKLVILR